MGSSTSLPSTSTEVWLEKLCFHGWKLKYAPASVQKNKTCVLVACRRKASAFQYASKNLRNDKEVVLEACRQNGDVYCFLSQELRNDPEVALTACRQSWYVLRDLSQDLRNDQELALTLCQQNGNALRDLSQNLRNDQEVVLAACRQNVDSIYYASQTLKADRDFMLEACRCDYRALKYATKLRGDKDFLLKICQHGGNALQFASEQLRKDKEIVLVAAASDPNALKHALDGLNQDEDCLIAAGIWDADYYRPNKTSSPKGHQTRDDETSATKNVVLSTRFALTEGSYSQATQFAILLKQHDYIQHHNFSVYSPNAFGKSTCDPKWTDFEWPCRGTYETCKMKDNLKTATPTLESCWRYSFRHQLEEAKRTKGFMVQLVELGVPYTRYTYGGTQTPGDGQKIETDMAHQVPTKIFRIYAPIKHRGTNREQEDDLKKADVDRLITEIRKWYGGNCKDMSECTIPAADEKKGDWRLTCAPVINRPPQSVSFLNM